MFEEEADEEEDEDARGKLTVLTDIPWFNGCLSTPDE